MLNCLNNSRLQPTRVKQKNINTDVTKYCGYFNQCFERDHLGK